MSLYVRPYCTADADIWDEFCIGALQATLIHTRGFLSYHGDRFVDCSLIIEEEGKCVGLFPAALSPSDTACVISHPGITYGGILHQGNLRGERMVEALTEICCHFWALGLNKLTYKAVPSFYQRAPAQDDIYALFQQTYLTTADRWQLGNYQLLRQNGSDGLEVTLTGPGGDVALSGQGNGVVDAFVQAMESVTGRHIVVVEYSEHTLGQSADAEAVCYVQLNIDGERPCGVGRSHDIVHASLAAILSALDGRGLITANAA